MNDSIRQSFAAGIAGLKVVDETLRQQREQVAKTMPGVQTRSQRVEAGLAAIEEAEAEREQLRSALQAAESDVRGLRAELDALQLAHSRTMTELDNYRRERDEAVTKFAALDAVYDAVLTVMQKHRPANPIDGGPAHED